MKVSTPAKVPAFPFADGIFPAGCPSRTVLDHVTSKWGVLILVALSEGPQRWSELRRRAEGISEKMLAQTLKTLEADGLVHRDAQPDHPSPGGLQPDPPRGGTKRPAAAPGRLGGRARRGDREPPGVLGPSPRPQP
jgi:DNA-binding HxlR family transcriptional regulator